MQQPATESMRRRRSGEGAAVESVLVTGATGFIGSYLVAELLAEGYRVRATGRRLEGGRRLQAAGARFLPVDLRDAEGMRAACEGVDAVVHAGATTNSWGPWEEFEAVNVEGTERTLEAARCGGARRFVYVSSPSVLFRFRDREGIDSEAKPPEEFASPYARSKWEAEERVRTTDDLETVVVRPRAVYGPGDRTLVPRLLRVARRGMLPQIGDGETRIQLTWVEDAARALRRAIEADGVDGETYHLTGGEPVEIWPAIEEILERLGVPGPAFELSTPTVMRVATGLEAVWSALSLPGEPPITRYKAGLLAHSQIYETEPTIRDLGWEPRVSVDEGIDRVVEQWDDDPPAAPGAPAQGPGAVSGAGCGSAVVERSRDRRDGPGSSDVEVRLELLCGGVCEAPGAAFAPGRGLERVDVPAMFALIRHPEHGVGLFDTGYSRRFRRATESFPARLYRWLTPPRLEYDYPARERLAERGVEPDQVDWIALSHFDPDHYGGLRDFPEADVVCTAEAWEHVRNRTGLEALHARLLPGHLPEDLAGRLRLVHGFEAPGVGPFDGSHDLFGDGSVRLVRLPGHAVGQYGAFVRTERNGGLFLAADGAWTRSHLEERPIATRAHRLIAEDRDRQNETYEKLWRLRHDVSDWTVVPSHCPEIARAFDVAPFANEEEL